MDIIRQSFVSAFLLAAISVPVITNAVVISPFELPSDIQACMSNGACAVNNSSLMDYNNASMFQYYDIANDSTGKLIRYGLVNSSQTEYDAITNFNGSIWLQASDQYNLSNSTHDFTLYLDNVTPAPMDMSYDGAPLSINLGLTTSDLISGGGYLSEYLDWDYGVVTSGALTTDGLPQLCLAIDCGIDALFNLVYLQYFSDGSTASLLPFLLADDSRGVLYSQRHYYDDGDPSTSYYAEQVFAVQAVPVPPAVWLFSSGLIGLVSFAKRKKAQKPNQYLMCKGAFLISSESPLLAESRHSYVLSLNKIECPPCGTF